MGQMDDVPGLIGSIVVLLVTLSLVMLAFRICWKIASLVV